MKERLEEIKQYYSSCKALGEDVESDIHWLISTVEVLSERLEGSHKYTDTMKLIADEQQKEIERLSNKVEYFREPYISLEKGYHILREALEFYAKEKNWTEGWVQTIEGYVPDVPFAIGDSGDKARQALKGDKS